MSMITNDNLRGLHEMDLSALDHRYKSEALSSMERTIFSKAARDFGIDIGSNRYIYSQIDTFEGVIWKVFVDLLTMGHPFLQANKRTAIVHTWELQRRNKVKVIYTDHKLAYALAVLIVNHKTDSMVLPQWVKTKRKLKLRRW